MTRTFKSPHSRYREVYTPPYDLASLARIISNNTDKYDRWGVYITIGCPENRVFGPYKVELNMLNGLWCIQSAETVYDLHMGDGCMEEGRGKLPDCSAESVYTVLKKASPQWA